MGCPIPIDPYLLYANKWYCLVELRYFATEDGCTGPYLEFKCCQNGLTIYNWMMDGNWCKGGNLSLCSATLAPTEISITGFYDTYIDCFQDCVE